MKLAGFSKTLKKLNNIFNNQIIIFVLLLANVVALTSCHSEKKNSDNKKPVTTTKKNNFGFIEQTKIVSNGDEYGIKVLAIRQTANGYMLDFRFRLIDAKKAEYIMQRKIKAYLTVEKNNAKLSVPMTYKLGSLRQSGKNLKENKNYFMLFANPGGLVKSGDLLTVEIAGFKAEHIIVN